MTRATSIEFDKDDFDCRTFKCISCGNLEKVVLLIAGD
jgi:hypothetical protein